MGTVKVLIGILAIIVVFYRGFEIIAQEHQIALAPEPIRVQRIGTPGAPAVCLAADYSRRSDKFAGMFLYPAFHSFQREPRDVGPWRLA